MSHRKYVLQEEKTVNTKFERSILNFTATFKALCGCLKAEITKKHEKKHAFPLFNISCTYPGVVFAVVHAGTFNSPSL